MQKKILITLLVICAVGGLLLAIVGQKKDSAAVSPGAATSSAEIQQLEEEFQSLRQQANATLEQTKNSWVDPLAREISSADADRLGSLLIREAAFGHLDQMKRLIQEGANVNAEKLGETPLIKAVKTNQPQAALLLLESGADINQPATSGKNPLQTAVDFGHLEMVQLLLEQPNIQLNQTDSRGNTVLMEAAQAGQLEIVQALVAAGAETGIKNKRGQTAFDVATTKRQAAVAEFLKNDFK